MNLAYGRVRLESRGSSVQSCVKAPAVALRLNNGDRYNLGLASEAFGYRRVATAFASIVISWLLSFRDWDCDRIRVTYHSRNLLRVVSSSRNATIRDSLGCKS